MTGVRRGVGEGVGVGVGAAASVGRGVGVGVGVGGVVGLRVRRGDGAAVGIGVGAGVTVGVAVGTGVGSGVAVGVADGSSAAATAHGIDPSMDVPRAAAKSQRRIRGRASRRAFMDRAYAGEGTAQCAKHLRYGHRLGPPQLSAIYAAASTGAWTRGASCVCGGR